MIRRFCESFQSHFSFNQSISKVWTCLHILSPSFYFILKVNTCTLRPFGRPSSRANHTFISLYIEQLRVSLKGPIGPTYCSNGGTVHHSLNHWAPPAPTSLTLIVMCLAVYLLFSLYFCMPDVPWGHTQVYRVTSAVYSYTEQMSDKSRRQSRRCV